MRRTGFLRKLYNCRLAYLFVLPAFLIILIFQLLPDIQALILSFYEWNGYTPFRKWIAGKNYLDAFGDPVFRQALLNNFIIVSSKIVIELFIAFVLALALNTKIRGRSIFRTGIFLPFVTTPVVIAFVWRGIYHPSNGIINAMLSGIGLGFLQTAWLGNIHTALPSLIAVSIWNWWGFSMIIFLSGLQTIPDELYEAAKIDGSSSFQQLVYLTIPLMKSVSVVAFVFCVINSFKLFTLVYVMTAGGPLHYTETISTWIYKNAFDFGNVGYAAAISFILFIIVFIVTLFQIGLTKDGARY